MSAELVDRDEPLEPVGLTEPAARVDRSPVATTASELAALYDVSESSVRELVRLGGPPLIK